MCRLLRIVQGSLLAISSAGSLAVAAPVTDHHLQSLWERGDLPGMERLAEAGDARAQRWMGLMLRNRGRHEEAISWYARAVDQGDGRSAAEIADFYERGIGRPGDAREAMGWYRRGAVRGDAMSQTRYASALRSGDFLLRNEAAAYGWYAAAVRQRYEYAYLPLAEMSAEGAGAPQDWKRAYALAVAAEFAVDDSDTQSQRRARSLRSKAAARLRPEERREAERLLAALRPDLAQRLARRSARGTGIALALGMLAAVGIGIAWWRGRGRAARGATG